jgi:D-cysteine desulfhydrase
MKINSLLLACLATTSMNASDYEALQILKTSNRIKKETVQFLEKRMHNQTTNKPICSPELLLFEKYPHLVNNVPHINIGSFPTPVTKSKTLGKKLGLASLTLKHDEKSAPSNAFCGNKVRKLEFLIAEAQSNNADEIISFGGVGSNNATAVAFYAQQYGFPCRLYLVDQPNSYGVRKNLLLMDHFGAQLNVVKNYDCGFAVVAEHAREQLERGKKFPYIIPFGGSNPLGTLGYVNAAFELQQQIDRHEIDKPDVIYLPLGSMGTTAGLALGLKLLKSDIQIMTVKVGNSSNHNALKKLFDATNAYLRSIDPSIPECTMDNVTVRTDFFGGKYGLFTPEAMEAKKLLHHFEKITLDGTYSAKAFACLVADARAGKLKDKNALFWLTFDYHQPTLPDYKKLPASFHAYFEKEVQPLEAR